MNMKRKIRKSVGRIVTMLVAIPLLAVLVSQQCMAVEGCPTAGQSVNMMWGGEYPTTGTCPGVDGQSYSFVLTTLHLVNPTGNEAISFVCSGGKTGTLSRLNDQASCPSGESATGTLINAGSQTSLGGPLTLAQPSGAAQTAVVSVFGMLGLVGAGLLLGA